jgi:hypothetical protein
MTRQRKAKDKTWKIALRIHLLVKCLWRDLDKAGQETRDKRQDKYNSNRVGQDKTKLSSIERYTRTQNNGIGKARQGKARQGKARQDQETQDNRR